MPANCVTRYYSSAYRKICTQVFVSIKFPISSRHLIPSIKTICADLFNHVHFHQTFLSAHLKILMLFADPRFFPLCNASAWRWANAIFASVLFHCLFLSQYCLLVPTHTYPVVFDDCAFLCLCVFTKPCDMDHESEPTRQIKKYQKNITETQFFCLVLSYSDWKFLELYKHQLIAQIGLNRK